MLIQCKNCQAKYKIDESRIPQQKAMVRCTNCGDAIPLPYSMESDSEVDENVTVVCEVCDTTYNIPQNKFTKDQIKVRCAKCGHEFQAQKEYKTIKKNIKPNSAKKPTFVKKNFKKDSPPKIELPSYEISQKDMEMEGLFDDFKEMEQASTAKSFDFTPSPTEERETTSPPPMPSPEDEYFDAIKLSYNEDHTSTSGNIRGSIPSDQKYKFFLQPNNRLKTTANSEKLESSEPRERENIGLDSESESNELPNINEFEGYDKRTFNQEADQKGKNFWLIIIGILLLTATLFGAIWIYIRTASDQQESLEQIIGQEKSTNEHSIQLMEPLGGKYLNNTNYSEKTYVIEGKLKNLFQSNDKIGWIEVQATLFDEKLNPLISNSVYAGNVLDEDSLKAWKTEKILAFLAYNNGRDKSNLDLTNEQELPFQVVFFNAPTRLGRIEAKVVSYVKLGRKISVP